jgi:murein DD-endopeptidase MepM/ murein hydrolase activator NlpD
VSGDLLSRLLLAAFVALLVVPAAAAHTDGGRQLALAWPAQGTVTAPYGNDNGRWHAGIDIGILRSLEIRAAAPGTVTEAGWPQGYEGYGEVVAVDVGSGYATLYAHLSRSLVHPGDRVEEGQLLGIAGCTGWCTGTHLHFELREEGVAVDPTLLLVG